MVEPAYNSDEIERIARGQRVMIIAIACGMAYPLPLHVVALPFVWVGVWRMTGGLRLSATGRILYMIGVVIPLMSLFLMFILNGRANRVFQAAGVRVGTWGADIADVTFLKARTSPAA